MDIEYIQEDNDTRQESDSYANQMINLSKLEHVINKRCISKFTISTNLDDFLSFYVECGNQITMQRMIELKKKGY